MYPALHMHAPTHALVHVFRDACMDLTGGERSGKERRSEEPVRTCIDTVSFQWPPLKPKLFFGSEVGRSPEGSCRE